MNDFLKLLSIFPREEIWITNEELEYIGHETETEVMGDSVGWKMQDNALNIIN